MRIGVAFPMTELGNDLGEVREYVQAAEDLGYDHIRILDHVLGADPRHHPEVDNFAYTYESVIHEVFTLMAYMAGITKTIELVTGILILPQRQTALVAKQAAEVDVLSGGRLRLGIGLGWNPVEYEALGENFHDRGKRCEEQIAVLRALWTQEVVSFTGKWHRITNAGINPLPVQRPIPIWIGAGRSTHGSIPPEVALRRIGRLADGWFAQFPPSQQAQDLIERVHAYARESGREPSQIGLEGRVLLEGSDPEPWINEMKMWEESGASHVALLDRRDGKPSPAGGFIESMRRFKEVTGGG